MNSKINYFLLPMIFFSFSSSKIQASLDDDFINAVKTENFEVMTKLLKRRANVSTFDPDGYTVLHWACKNNKLATVEALINCLDTEWKLQAALDTPDHYGKSALHYAAQEGHIGCLLALINAGANITIRDRTNWTALYYALINNHQSCITELSTRINKSKDTPTDLHEAAAKGNYPILNALIAADADVHATDERKSTALHYAALNGHTDCAKAQVNAKDSQGNTPLHSAAQNGHSDCVKVLIDANARDPEGNTPLHLATQSGHDNCVKILIQEQADVDAQNSAGASPLHNTALFLGILRQ